MIKEICIAFLTGGVAVALVEWAKDSIKKRKAKKDVIRNALMYLLYDRIRFLCLEYLKANEIDVNDKKMLGDMHRSYHHDLGGNGDLNSLIEQVNSLPITDKGKRL